MKTLAASEAKTYFSELLKRVSKGEAIRITLRGIHVATLVPNGDGERKDLKRIVREIRKIQQKASLGGLTSRELVNEGRRY